MKREALISVIIPVYNPGKHLYKCLDSVINQTYSNLEIILIDDGSIDGSSELCDLYKKKDDRIVCIHKGNEGVSSARNLGLEIAKGDYYHFLDSDDYLELNTYEYLVSLIQEHGCDAVTFEYYITYEAKEIVHCVSEELYGMANREETLIALMRGKMLCCDKFYSKKLVEGLKFRNDIHRGEDTLFAAYALERADKVWFDKKPLYHYVQSEDSACRGRFRESQLTVLQLYDAYNPLFERYKRMESYFLLFMQDILISLYYDIWADENSFTYSKGKKEIYNMTSTYYRKVNQTGLVSNKQKIKFRLFNVNPDLFCVLHKIIQRL